MLVVVGKQHALATDAPAAVAPLGQEPLGKVWRALIAMIPAQLGGGLFAMGQVVKINHQRVRRSLSIRLGAFDDLDPARVPQTKRPVAQVDVVAAYVGERAPGEVPPLAPVERMMCRMIRNVITVGPSQRS